MAAPFSILRSFSGPGADDFIRCIASDLGACEPIRSEPDPGEKHSRRSHEIILYRPGIKPKKCNKPGKKG